MVEEKIPKGVGYEVVAEPRESLDDNSVNMEYFDLLIWKRKEIITNKFPALVSSIFSRQGCRGCCA